MSMSRAVIAEEPSVPFILKFLSAVLTVNSTSVELLPIFNIVVPPSLNIMLPLSASSVISLATSTKRPSEGANNSGVVSSDTFDNASPLPAARPETITLLVTLFKAPSVSSTTKN